MDRIDYKKMIADAPFGYAYNRLILDDKGIPVDYEFIELNSSFEKLSGIKGEILLGKRITEAIPAVRDDPFDWITFYGNIVLKNETAEVEYYSEPLQRWYRVHVTPQIDLCFVTMFYDITELKYTESQLRERTVSLDRRVIGMNLLMKLSVYAATGVITSDSLFSFAANIIKDAMPDSERVSVRIKFRDKMFTTDLFTKTGSGIKSDFLIRGEITGYIEIFLPDETASFNESSYGKDVRELIDIMAHYLGQFAEKIEANEALERSHAKLKQYLNFAPDGIFIVNGAGRYLEVNPAACELLGYSEKEFLSMSISDTLFPETLNQGLAGFNELIFKGHNSMEIPLKRKDGNKVCVAIDSVELPDGRYMAFCKDISERKRFQNELLKSAIFNQTLIDTIPTPIYYKNMKGEYLEMNRAFAEFFGRSKEELTGKHLWDIVPAELTEIFIKMDRELMMKPGVQVFEAPLIDSKNILHDVMLHKAVYYDDQGNPEGIIGVIIDISERRKFEKELELYFKSIQSIDQPLLITDRDGNIIKVNNAFIKMYGYNLDELIGRNPSVLNPGKDVYLNFGYTEVEYNDLFSSLWRSIKDSDTGTWENIVINRKKDGNLLWVRLLINTVYNEFHQPVNYIALPVDISGTLQRESMTKVQLYQTIASLAELRDNETGNHMRRVGIFAKLLAQELHMPEKYCDDIEIFAPLHDIGKVGILDSLLLAERKLTTEEFEVMKTHTTLGYSIVKGKKELEMVAAITIGHHEWYDGSGYPRGLTGEDIPLSARITSIADVYDALRSRRPYKSEWSHKYSADYILQNSGRQFDPKIVSIFSNINRRFESIYNELKD